MSDKKQAKLTDREKKYRRRHKVVEFAQQIAFANADPKTVYKELHPDCKWPRQCAYNLLQRASVQELITKFQAKKANELAKAERRKQAKLIIDRVRQTAELEKLRKKCMRKDKRDYRTALGCLAEMDKIYGLALDVNIQADLDLNEEMTAEQRERAEELLRYARRRFVKAESEVIDAV